MTDLKSILLKKFVTEKTHNSSLVVDDNNIIDHYLDHDYDHAYTPPLKYKKNFKFFVKKDNKHDMKRVHDRIILVSQKATRKSSKHVFNKDNPRTFGEFLL
jgi:hypothetical protein